MGRAANFSEPDLSGIVERADSDGNWNGDAAKIASAKKWYVAFLHAVYNSPGGRCYIVTDEADQLWHTHMTFSVRYRAFCESILGFYLDHTPPLDSYQATATDITNAKASYQQILPVGDINKIGVVPYLIKPCW